MGSKKWFRSISPGLRSRITSKLRSRCSSLAGGLDDLARSDIGIGEGAELDEFHPVSPCI